VYGIFTSFAK